MLFDAVALLSSHQSIEVLVKEAAARDFVADAFQQCKFIGYDQSALPLLDKAGVSSALDEGMIEVSSAKDVGEFVRMLGKLRVGGTRTVLEAWQGVPSYRVTKVRARSVIRAR